MESEPFSHRVDKVEMTFELQLANHLARSEMVSFSLSVAGPPAVFLSQVDD